MIASIKVKVHSDSRDSVYAAKFTGTFFSVLSCENGQGYRISKRHCRKAMLIKVEKLLKRTNEIANKTERNALMAFSYDFFTRHSKSMFCIRTNLCRCYYLSRFFRLFSNLRHINCIKTIQHVSVAIFIRSLLLPSIRNTMSKWFFYLVHNFNVFLFSCCPKVNYLFPCILWL